MDYLSKIKPLDEIVALAEQAKREGKTVVTTNGSYDIVHAGHVQSLYEARNQGDLLIVGVNSDKSVREYKSADRPIIGEQQRAAMLAGLGCVDYVFLFDETVPMPYLERIKPQIHANGADYGEECIEKETVEHNGGQIYLLKKVEGISTSEIIKKVLAVYGPK